MKNGKEPSDAASADDAHERQHGEGGQLGLMTAEAKRAQDLHFRELYTGTIDFKNLAALDPDFATVIKGRELNFNDPNAVMQLTKTLLKLDFGLNVELPDDRLCPPVANRHNYILWLKGLLDTTLSSDKPDAKLVGLDIGTGAGCIYPLLGCTQRPWSFIATDIDEKSLEWAKKNVELNDLGSRINLVKRKAGDALIPIDDLGIDSIAFTMTNPPFYESEEAMIRSAAEKSRAPFTACTGAKVEMVTEGGEVGFVSKILEESLVLRDRVQWYSTMVGFLASLTHIVDKLREHEIDNYAIAEFLQGKKTRRWAIAWSFQPLRPTQDIARGIKSASFKGILPPQTEINVIVLPIPDNIGRFTDHLSSAIAALDLISWNWDKQRMEGVGRAVDKVWSRAWRRRKMKPVDDTSGGMKVEKEKKSTGFGFMVSVRVSREGVSVEARWMEGHDETAFESFRGFVKAKAMDAVKGSEG